MSPAYFKNMLIPKFELVFFYELTLSIFQSLNLSVWTQFYRYKETPEVNLMYISTENLRTLDLVDSQIQNSRAFPCFTWRALKTNPS